MLPKQWRWTASQRIGGPGQQPDRRSVGKQARIRYLAASGEESEEGNQSETERDGGGRCGARRARRRGRRRWAFCARDGIAGDDARGRRELLSGRDRLDAELSGADHDLQPQRSSVNRRTIWPMDGTPAMTTKARHGPGGKISGVGTPATCSTAEPSGEAVIVDCSSRWLRQSQCRAQMRRRQRRTAGPSASHASSLHISAA